MRHESWSSCCAAVVLVWYGVVAAQSSTMKQSGMEHGPMHEHSTQSKSCRGFVVLPNGYAVMSGMSEMGGMSGMSSHGHDAMKHDGMEMKPGDMQSSAAHHSMESMEHQAGMKDHLMGLRHGEDIKVTAGMLCVPLDQSKDSWPAVSADKDLQVTAKSIRGPLAHNSRDNEAFELRVMQGRTPVENADVVFIARMPQHDRSLARGHGLANDPDAKGIAARPLGKGRYVVDLADFSMPGSWFFEVRVKKGEKVAKAYFATPVGQE
jgi:hypothetical protein